MLFCIRSFIVTTALLRALPATANPPVEPDAWDLQIASFRNTIEAIDARLAESPMRRASGAVLVKARKAALARIEEVGNKNSDDPAAQLAAGYALASVHEGARAIVFAERGLKIAETSGDLKVVRTALLTGSAIYEKAGNYELARARAQRILKANPQDKDALALYMQATGRGAVSAAPTGPSPTNFPAPRERAHPTAASPAPRRSVSSRSPALPNMADNDPSLIRAAKHYASHCSSTDKYSCDAAQISNSCFDSSAKNTCARNCLVSRDELCVTLDPTRMPGCRIKAHLHCYLFCRKFIPTIIETSCYTKLWGSLLGNTK